MTAKEAMKEMEEITKNARTKAAPPTGGTDTGLILPGSAGDLPNPPPMIDLDRAARFALDLWEKDREAGVEYWLRARRLAGQKV